MVAISGDLTQRARSHEFQKARAFLSRLGVPYVVVPGNHDIAPLSSPAERLFKPLERYEDGLGEASVTGYVDTELAIVGLDSVSRYRVKQGELKSRTLAVGLDELSVNQRPLRVLVSHHPMGIVRVLRGGRSRSPRSVEAQIADAEVALHLCGHAHTSTSRLLANGDSNANFVEIGAGTATSRRMRGEVNAFNAIELTETSITLTVHQLGAERFRPTSRTRYERVGKRWELRTPAEVLAASDTPVNNRSLSTPEASPT